MVEGSSLWSPVCVISVFLHLELENVIIYVVILVGITGHKNADTRLVHDDFQISRAKESLLNTSTVVASF